MKTEIGKTIIVSKELHSYSSHPCITLLNNGDWLVPFSQSTQRVPYTHPPGDPRYVNMMTRSTDMGAAWLEPRVAPDYDWYGVEVPGITSLSSDEVLLNQWRFLWYPKELGKKLWKEGRSIFVRNPTSRRWQPIQTEKDWEDHPHPYVRADGGAYVHISTDFGYTWDTTVRVEIAPYQGAFSPQGAVELQNGEIVLALGSHDHDPLAASFIVKSSDKGRSWGKPIEAAREEGLVFSEPSAAQTKSGKLLLASREDVHGFIYLSESTDNGNTWQNTRKLSLWGCPIHCLSLADGRVFIVYGRRKAPFGIRAAISKDEGTTWSEEIIVRDDLPNSNLGYPTAIEYEPGKIFVVYYGEDTDGVTCIQGTYLTV